MKKFCYWLLAALLIGTAAFLPACKKGNSLSTPPEELASFPNTKAGSYVITTPTTVFKIPVAFAAVADRERTVNVSVTSPTGAVRGTHYNIPSTFVIPAGKAVDSLVVQGIYSQYLAGRKDTLVFRITQDVGTTSEINTTYTLFMRGPCFAADINTDFALLAGTYSKTNETYGTNPPYGPYTTTISSVTKTSATTADIMVTNLYDDSPKWNPLKFTLDWSDLANPKITLLQQVAGGNAGNTFGATYAGQAHAVRPVPGGAVVGTFDFCAQKLTLRMNIGINGVGFSSTLYTVVLER